MICIGDGAEEDESCGIRYKVSPGMDAEVSEVDIEG